MNPAQTGIDIGGSDLRQAVTPQAFKRGSNDQNNKLQEHTQALVVSLFDNCGCVSVSRMAGAGMSKTRSNEEHQIQTAIISYLDIALPGTIRAVGVSNNPRSKIAGAHEKARGMRKGFPDILLLGSDIDVPVIGLIEVKREDGRLTKEQREWQSWCHSSGVPHAVCRSIDDAKDALQEWGLA
jgi:hypothetical protein